MKKILRKIILGVFLLYGYNLIAVTFGVSIPINVLTVALVSIFDIPAMLILALPLIFIF